MLSFSSVGRRPKAASAGSAHGSPEELARFFNSARLPQGSDGGDRAGSFIPWYIFKKRTEHLYIGSSVIVT